MAVRAAGGREIWESLFFGWKPRLMTARAGWSRLSVCCRRPKQGVWNCGLRVPDTLFRPSATDSYLRVRAGDVAETQAIEEGVVYADYGHQGALLGIELLGPCQTEAPGRRRTLRGT